MQGSVLCRCSPSVISFTLVVAVHAVVLEDLERFQVAGMND